MPAKLKHTPPWTLKPEYFNKNSDGSYRPHKAKWRLVRRRYWFDKYKQAKGCVHCGYNTHPLGLAFDHRDPEIKSGSVTGNWLFRPDGYREAIAEARKCDVVCHNCHAQKTHVNNEYRQAHSYEERLEAFNKYHRKDM